MIWSLVSKLLHRVSVKPLIRSLENPVAAQEKALNMLLNYSAGTAFGKRHGFSDIRDYQDFIEKVPVNQYKDFEPYIQQELKGIPNVFYPEPIEVVMATSGTTGEPKLIPYTRFCIKSLNSMRIRAFAAADQIRPFLHGKILTMAAPSVYKQIGKWTVGYVTGHAAKTGNFLFRRKIVPSADIFDIEDWDEKFREAIRQGVEHRKITACGGVTSFVLALLRRTKYQSYRWLKDDPAISHKTLKILRDALIDEDTLELKMIWPDLSVIFNTGVVRDLYAPSIRDFVGDVHIHDAYGGTEGMYGFQVYAEMKGVAPFVDEVFFEFAKDYPGPLPPDVETLPLSDVKPKTPYRMIVSSPSGLWRYDVHDLVIFDSVDPLDMRCIGKSENIINLSGEKVSEWDIGTALTTACEEQGIQLREFVVAPEVKASGATYHIFVELTENPENMRRFMQVVDETLREVNNCYLVIRDAGTLNSVVVHALPTGSFDTYQYHRLQSGQCTVGQTKMPRITTFEHVTQYLMNGVPIVAP
jgi:hypothetical protein